LFFKKGERDRSFAGPKTKTSQPKNDKKGLLGRVKKLRRKQGEVRGAEK